MLSAAVDNDGCVCVWGGGGGRQREDGARGEGFGGGEVGGGVVQVPVCRPV